MIHRRTFLCGLTLGTLAAPLAAQPAKVNRIGFLTPGPVPQLSEPLIAQLRERGWTVGSNLVIETRYTDGDPQRAEALARGLVEERVDLIVTNITATAMAARRATSVVLIVMMTRVSRWRAASRTASRGQAAT
jgi:ABC-type uncharacterized transport system substrate-binding protein